MPTAATYVGSYLSVPRFSLNDIRNIFMILSRSDYLSSNQSWHNPTPKSELMIKQISL